MKGLSVGMVVAIAAWCSLPQAIEGQGVLSRFEGSVEKGVYESDYDALRYPQAIAVDADVERVEGSMVSRVFVKPEQKSNLEVFRSYERELESRGFTVHLAGTPQPALQQTIWNMYRAPNLPLTAREYQNTEGTVLDSDLARIGTFADYYLVASRSQGGQDFYVGIILSRELNLYLVDEVTRAAMETGTVSIDLESMRSDMETAGKVAVYDIFFATGSALIEPESAPALGVIAGYLSESQGAFYIVGHTDDTGTLEGNLTLSRERAAAVKQALVGEHGIAAGRLETRGVGPLVPVASNEDEAGRANNRRVEVVQRLHRN